MLYEVITTLAVEDLNARGGVAGRQIRLLVEDDLGTPEGAVAADARLRKEGVVAIIGHMTSGLSAAALPEAERAHRALFSPSSSSPAFTGKADVFFRTAPSSLDEAAALAVITSYSIHYTKLYESRISRMKLRMVSLARTLSAS